MDGSDAVAARFLRAVLGRDGLPTGIIITEDFKGCKTPVYRLKRKLMAACYPASRSRK